MEIKFFAELTLTGQDILTKLDYHKWQSNFQVFGWINNWDRNRLERTLWGRQHRVGRKMHDCMYQGKTGKQCQLHDSWVAHFHHLLQIDEKRDFWESSKYVKQVIQNYLRKKSATPSLVMSPRVPIFVWITSTKSASSFMRFLSGMCGKKCGPAGSNPVMRRIFSPVELKIVLPAIPDKWAPKLCPTRYTWFNESTPCSRRNMIKSAIRWPTIGTEKRVTRAYSIPVNNGGCGVASLPQSSTIML